MIGFIETVLDLRQEDLRDADGVRERSLCESLI